MNKFTGFFANLFESFFNKRTIWTSMGGGRRTIAREDVSEDTALNYSAVWCATRLICGTAASLPFPVFSGRDGDNRKKERLHPVYRILNGSPNPEQTAYNFRSVMWQWQVNWGNAYAEIVREGNSPFAPIVELWPLHPCRVKPCRDENKALYYEVANEQPGTPTELEPWQMLHIPSIITYDGLVGHGVVSHARESIGAGIAAEKYGANWFGGAAVPRVVVKHPGKWNPDVRKAFREEWDEIHSGAAGSRVALLEGGADVVPLSLSAEDSQFLQTREFGVAEVARWYGVPPHLLQHLLQATFSNVEQLGISFVQYSLIPWLRIWEQCVWQKLLTPTEQETYFAEHNVDGLLRGDAAARASYYQSMTSSAIMTRNQCRKLENFDPVDGGDTFLVQGAMVPLDDDGKPESKFVGGVNAQSQSMQNSGQSDSEAGNENPSDQPNVEQIKTTVANRIKKVLTADLSRMLTKESLRMVEYAKKPHDFIGTVDRFYAEHSDKLRDVIYETTEALSACGLKVNREMLISEWSNEGKSLIIEAAGTVGISELSERVQGIIESKTWSERPNRAVEKACGGPGSGVPGPCPLGKHRENSSGKPASVTQKQSSRVSAEQKKISERAARAKAAYNPSTKQKQDEKESIRGIRIRR